MTAKINETCFGNEGLGLPIGGIEENADNITNETILKFYMENVSPERVFICAAGIKDHKSFIDLLEKKINKMILSSFYKKRTKSIFKGGLTVIPSDGEEVHCAIAFESVKNIIELNIILNQQKKKNFILKKKMLSFSFFCLKINFICHNKGTLVK